MPKIDVYNCSGGQNSKTSPLFIDNSECELVQNYHMDNLGSLTKRAGIATPLLTAGTPQIVNNKSDFVGKGRNYCCLRFFSNFFQS